MMQIQIDIKDTVKFLAQPQDPQDSIIQVTEARSFISVKTMSVTLNINATTADPSILTSALQVSTSQGHRGVQKLSQSSEVTKRWDRSSSKHGWEAQRTGLLVPTAYQLWAFWQLGKHQSALLRRDLGLWGVPLTIALLNK